MGTTRRTFVKRTAGFTGASFVGLKAGHGIWAQTREAKKNETGEEASGWYDRPMRWDK